MSQITALDDAQFAQLAAQSAVFSHTLMCRTARRRQQNATTLRLTGSARGLTRLEHGSVHPSLVDFGPSKSPPHCGGDGASNNVTLNTILEAVSRTFQPFFNEQLRQTSDWTVKFEARSSQFDKTFASVRLFGSKLEAFSARDLAFEQVQRQHVLSQDHQMIGLLSSRPAPQNMMA